MATLELPATDSVGCSPLPSEKVVSGADSCVVPVLLYVAEHVLPQQCCMGRWQDYRCLTSCPPLSS